MFELDPRVRENVIAWEGEAGKRWLESLPIIVAELAERWQLSDFGLPLPGGSHSYVATVRSPEGDAVLKVALLGDENRLEAEALRLYAGDGAVRLLNDDAASGALLLERCSPETPLSDHADRDEAINVACGLLRRLRREPPAGHGFILVSEKASEWVTALAQRLEEVASAASLRPLIEEAIGLAREFAKDVAPGVLVNVTPTWATSSRRSANPGC
jgi:streptomycin 6-kinase